MRLDGSRAARAVHFGRLVFGLWIAVLLIVCVRSFFYPRTHSVYPIFAQAGRDWMADDDAYFPGKDRNLDQYRYSPLVTVSLIPFSTLPDALGGVLWRLLNVGVYLGGFLWFCQRAWHAHAGPNIERLPHERWAGGMARKEDGADKCRRSLVLLLLLPLSIGSLNNGQANLLTIGLLLIGVTACVVERWTLAAVTVALACYLKLYPLAIGLLLIVVFAKQFSWRFGLAMALGFVLPFALGNPAYVGQAYSSWLDRLAADQRTFSPESAGYRDCWFLLKTCGVPITRQVYLFLQLGAACTVAAVCAVGRLQGCSARQLAGCVFSLGCCWMVLFGPATESCTYCFVAPVLARVGVERLGSKEAVWTRLCIWVILALLVASQASRWFPQGRDWTSPLLPLGALLLFADQLFVSVKRLYVSDAHETTPGPLARAA